VGKIPTPALFLVVRRRRRTTHEYPVSTNHPLPKHSFQALLGALLKISKLTSRYGISSILTNQRTFLSRFLIYLFLVIFEMLNKQISNFFDISKNNLTTIEPEKVLIRY
jgi:hypothetical protein